MNKQETIKLFNLLLAKNGLEVEIEKVNNELESITGELAVAQDLLDKNEYPRESSVMTYSQAIVVKYAKLKDYHKELISNLKEISAKIEG